MVRRKRYSQKDAKMDESWKELNPQWEYKLWDEQNIKELNIEDLNVYSKKFNPGYRSDILRYIILKNLEEFM